MTRKTAAKKDEEAQKAEEEAFLEEAIERAEKERRAMKETSVEESARKGKGGLRERSNVDEDKEDVEDEGDEEEMHEDERMMSKLMEHRIHWSDGGAIERWSSSKKGRLACGIFRLLVMAGMHQETVVPWLQRVRFSEFHGCAEAPTMVKELLRELDDDAGKAVVDVVQGVVRMIPCWTEGLQRLISAMVTALEITEEELLVERNEVQQMLEMSGASIGITDKKWM